MNITSLSIADNIYQDISTGKYILSGVYYQIEIPELPYRLPFRMQAYCAFEKPPRDCELEFSILCEADKSIIALTESIKIPSDHPVDFFQLNIEFPSFNIVSSGNYSIRVKVNGIIVKKSPFKIKLADDQ